MPEAPRWWNVGVVIAVAIIALALVVAIVGAVALGYFIHELGQGMMRN